MRLPQDRAWLTNAALVLFGCFYVSLVRTGTHEWTHYVHGFSEDLFGQLVLYLGGIALVEGSETNKWTLPLILLLALALRLPALVAPPFLSTDIFRYVWDGKVANAGINPFRYIPADPHLSFLRDGSIYPHINRKEYAHTIYPPGAQMLYMIVARVHASVFAMKVALLGFEAATCLALVRCLRLLKQKPERVILYAWHPVLVWEVASSGHIDAAALLFIALALLWGLRDKPLGASAWLAGAALVKLYPAALLPALARRRWLAAGLLFFGVLAAGYLPYLSVGKLVLGFLPDYAKEEGMNTGERYFPLAWAGRVLRFHPAPGVYLVFCAAALAGLALWALRRGRRLPAPVCVSSGLLLATALNLCFSPHYPWYFLWLLPFLPLWPWRPALYIVTAVTYMLATKLGAPGEGIYQMNVRLYGGFFIFLLIDLAEQAWRQRKLA